MNYPNFIKKGDLIGITAPSDGIIDECKLNRLDNANLKLKKLGFNIWETPNVRSSFNGRSSHPIERAKQLEELYLNKNVSCIFCAAGGDFLVELLPFLNLNIIKKNLKWIQGFSDPTALLYTITTKLDIATIYSNNYTAFGMDNWHISLDNNLKILQGNIPVQNSFDKFESSYQNYLTGLESYNLDKIVYWESLLNDSHTMFKGRLIGGCFDVLLNILGTKYDGTNSFLSKYKKDGIVWFFDICELTNEEIIRGLWKFKELGYFKYTSGIILGRLGEEKSCYNFTLKNILNESLSELNIPVIFNADIGHRPPQLTFINGALCEVESKNGKGSIKFILK